MLLHPAYGVLFSSSDQFCKLYFCITSGHHFFLKLIVYILLKISNFSTYFHINYFVSTLSYYNSLRSRITLRFFFVLYFWEQIVQLLTFKLLVVILSLIQEPPIKKDIPHRTLVRSTVM